MFTKVMNFLPSRMGISFFGCFELATVAAILYFIYTKTRTYRSSFGNLNVRTVFTTWYNKITSEAKTNLVLKHGVGTRNMLQLTPHSGLRPFGDRFNWGMLFPFVAQSVRSKKYVYPQISHLVSQDPLLQRAIKQATEQSLNEQRPFWTAARRQNTKKNTGQLSITDDDEVTYAQILKQQESRARIIIKEMSSTLNNFLLGLTSWILYKLLPCFLSGVVTHTEQIEMLKRASDRAPGVPLIFMPLHRSHLDYIMVTFILTNNDIKSPLVAAGNNLQIPVFGGLLRGLGAFFIKRKIDPVVGKKDILYRAILQLYLQHALRKGHNVEFFIEGGRTRTGKPCMPKGGILSVIVNAFMDRSITDALIVPVSVNYERLVDGNFVREQKGERKVPETFGKAMRGIWKALNSNYGLMRIDFNEPYSIKELVKSYNQIAKEEGNKNVYTPASKKLQHNISTSSLYGTDVVCEEHRTLIDSISRQVVFDCAVATTVMSTNAMAFLLLTQFREGGVAEEIASGLDGLRQQLKNRKDMGFSGDSLHIINYATDLLGNGLVKRSLNDRGQYILQPVPTIDAFIELAYYSNSLTPYFALESIIMITFHNMLTEKERKSENEAGVSEKRLLLSALENCDVFRYEFILTKPTQTLESVLDVKIDELKQKNYLRVSEERDVIPIRYKAKFDTLDDESDDDFTNVEEYELNDLFLVQETLKEQKAMCEILAPFSYTYLTVANCLYILFKNPMLESEFIKYIIADLSNQVMKKSCPYAESISTDTVRNCLKLLEKWAVIQICNERGLRLLSLGTLYETSKDSLKSVTARISAVMPNYSNSYLQTETNNQPEEHE